MVRQAIYFLPEAIRTFEKEQPGIQVTPLFQYDNGVDSLRGSLMTARNAFTASSAPTRWIAERALLYLSKRFRSCTNTQWLSRFRGDLLTSYHFFKSI